MDALIKRLSRILATATENDRDAGENYESVVDRDPSRRSISDSMSKYEDTPIPRSSERTCRYHCLDEQRIRYTHDTTRQRVARLDVFRSNEHYKITRNY